VPGFLQVERLDEVVRGGDAGEAERGEAGDDRRRRRRVIGDVKGWARKLDF
jgi:hypothetical protein